MKASAARARPISYLRNRSGRAGSRHPHGGRARAPDGFANIEDVIPRDELERISRTYKELAKFDVQSVNS